MSKWDTIPDRVAGLIAIILVSVLLSWLFSSCASDPVPYRPPPPVGSYIITQRGENGEALHQFEVDSYEHNFFPPSVSFDVDGKRTTIRGSWDVDVK